MIRWVCCLVLLHFAAPCAAAPVIRSVRPSAPSVPRYALFELRINLSAQYENPFDPGEVDVWAKFTGPGGTAARVNGFLYRPHRRALVGGREQITAAGEPGWRVRFAAGTVGVWRYRVHVRDRTGEARSAEGSVRVTPSANPGFVRRSLRSPRMFAFAGEKPFVPIGENMAWSGARGSFDYDAWLRELAAAGGNWVRVWMVSWSCALEWSAPAGSDWRDGGYSGVGRYSLSNAWKLDTILDTAARHGVYVQLCFGTYGDFTTGGIFNEGQWNQNPYNAANGGPCERPDQFWTDPRAREFYRRRLRYIAARWGWRTNVQAWEFWNEALAPPGWVGEMARSMKGTGEFKGKGLDPFGHLLSTTYGNAAVWRLPEIDFAQTHSYGIGNIDDHAPLVSHTSRQQAATGKPHLMAEFGIDHRKSDREYDPQGVGANFRSGLWSGLASLDAGTAMAWWWDDLTHPRKLYRHFTAVRRFSDRVPWTAGPWRPVEAGIPRAPRGTGAYSDLRIPAGAGWGRAPAERFEVGPGGIAGDTPFGQYLYGPAKPDLRTTPEFAVDFARPGRFVLHIDEVAALSRIQISVDGAVVKDITLRAAPPDDPKAIPEYESTQLMPEYGIYRARFNRSYAVDVPAGRHVVRVANVEGDWASINAITLEGYRGGEHPPLRVFGRTTGRHAVLWLQNAEHNWRTVRDGKAAPPITGSRVTVKGLRPGRYTLQWIDTTTGAVLRAERVTARAAGLALRVPTVRTDVAALVLPRAAR